MANDEADALVVSVERGDLQPDVLFEMLNQLALRDYNIRTQKDQNIYLREVPDGAGLRVVQSELPASTARVRPWSTGATTTPKMVRGEALASGYYFYLINGGGRTQRGRLALIR